MNIHSPSKALKVKNSVLTAITAAANNGSAVDALGFTRAQATFVSAPSGTGTTSDCKLQESDASGSGYADVTSAAFAQVTTAGGQQTQVMDIDLTKRKRYLRLVHTGAGGSAAGVAVANIILINGNTPVSQDNTVVSV